MGQIGTYSIVALDPETGELGVAVQSKFFAVGTVVPYAKADLGAIATQAQVNVSYADQGFELLKKGIVPQEIVDRMVAEDDDNGERQVSIIDTDSNIGHYTGSDCLDFAGHIKGKNFCCQGNILASEKVLENMVDSFENTEGHLGLRMLAALDGAEAAGGDKRGRQAAALLIVKKEGGYLGKNDRYIDLRVDDNPEPLIELRRLYEVRMGCNH
jgi:uncharacterized Ntn-hydrolase superfamily protein